MRRGFTWCLVGAGLLAACNRPSEGEGGSPPANVAFEEIKSLIAQGQLDAALSRLQGMPQDADNFYYQGLVWGRKAEAAPLPTPPPAASPLPRDGELPVAPEFKESELQALGMFEKALSIQPRHVPSHLALAELLAPHAARRYDREETFKKTVASRRRGQAAPVLPPPPAGPDFSPDRVIQSYKAAVEGDPASNTAIDALARFGARVGRLDAADFAYQSLVGRQKDNPDILVRYGEFLIQHKKDADGAIAQYRQALIWRPNDDATKARIADIYLDQGVGHFNKGEWVVAEARFKEAERFVTDRRSAQGVRLADYTQRLHAIRRPR